MLTKASVADGSGPRSSERCVGAPYTPGCRPQETVSSAPITSSSIWRITKCEYNSLIRTGMGQFHVWKTTGRTGPSRLHQARLWRKRLQGFEIAAVVAFDLHGRFGNESLAAQFGIRQKAAKGLGADVALADLGVAIHAGAQRRFGIVGVKDVDMVEIQNALRLAESGAQAGHGGDVETRGEQVAGVQAVPDREIAPAACQIADGSQFLKAAAHRGAAAGGVLQQNRDAAPCESVGRLAQAPGTSGDSLFQCLAFVAAGVDYQKLRSEDGRALQFPAEGLNGFGANRRVPRGQVDQVVDVAHQRVDVMPPADVAERLHLGGVGGPGAPHARAGREDLECIRADFDGPQRGLFERAESV